MLRMFHVKVMIFLYFIFPVVAGALKNSFHNMAGMAFKPVVLCGPSGSGKSTLVKKLMEEFQGCFAFTISRKFIYLVYAGAYFLHLRKRSFVCKKTC